MTTRRLTDEMSAIGRLIRCAEREAPYLSNAGWTLALKQIGLLAGERRQPDERKK